MNNKNLVITVRQVDNGFTVQSQGDFNPNGNKTSIAANPSELRDRVAEMLDAHLPKPAEKD